MNGFKQIDAPTVRSWVNEGQVTIVDIRDEDSFKEEHIPGAVSLSREDVVSFIEKADKNKPLVCYCYHGISSQNAAQYFAQQGFREVYSLIGGYEQWRCLV